MEELLYLLFNMEIEVLLGRLLLDTPIRLPDFLCALNGHNAMVGKQIDL